MFVIAGGLQAYVYYNTRAMGKMQGGQGAAPAPAAVVNALQIGVKTVLDQGRHWEHTFPPPGDGKEVSAKAAEALENLALQIKSMPEVEELFKAAIEQAAPGGGKSLKAC